MASMMTKRKMLARLTIASAMPARLIGLRSSMRERCHGSAEGGGVFSVSMFHTCGFGFLLVMRRGFNNGNWLIRSFGDHRSVESMLFAIVVQRHFSVPPRPVHGINIRVEKHLVEVPDDDRQGGQHRLVIVNGGRHIEPPARHLI